ncbi:MAG TPA: 50S ribosomal protein L22 [Polyangiaceae bacterium]|nr:50S ribosomal protein L22 [Polyangiaceae bacterium]
MVSKAIARFARISPRKARVVVDLVRGRQAGEALQLLEFTAKSGAPVLKKVIESAVANARTQSPDVDLDALFVQTAFVDKAPNKHMRRWRPRAMGRETRVQKGMSHITVELGVRD